MITGTRTDNFARSHPLANQAEKPAEFRGRYLHPETFGLATERGVTYKIQQDLERQKPQERTHKPGGEEESR